MLGKKNTIQLEISGEVKQAFPPSFRSLVPQEKS